MALTKKQVYARVSKPDSVFSDDGPPTVTPGAFIATWSNIDFRGFGKTLNGGPGECVFGLAVAFDYFGEDLQEGNNVDIILQDADTLADVTSDFTTRLLYRGYISLIERDVDGGSDTVTVHLLGYYTLLDLDVLRSGEGGAQTTLFSDSTHGIGTSSASSTNTGKMARALIDLFSANGTPGKIFYESGDIPDTDDFVQYTFIQQTYREALDGLKSIAPPGVYWYVDETGRITFKAVAAAPVHTFIFGRHISKVHVERSIEKTRNVVLIAGFLGKDDLYKHYQDNPSIGAYGRRLERIADNGLTDENAMDAAGAKFLAENKDAFVKVVATIIDNANMQNEAGYDIEDIQPGDTCRFVGFSPDLSDIFQDNMIITGVNYRLDSVEITVELIKSGLVDTQSKQAKQIKNINSLLIGGIYT